MNESVGRRGFLCAGATALSAGFLAGCSTEAGDAEASAGDPSGSVTAGHGQTPRSLFPRAETEVFLNAAGGAPLSRFTERGLARYMDFIRHGPADGRGDYFEEVWSGIRGRFATLVGADESEISLVHCTKAGEQLVMDGLPKLQSGGNVVTNDFHFSGSLHNLFGMREAGYDVRIVKSDGRDLDVQAMLAAMDERTALVSVTLLSNVNGRIEPIRELVEAAHDRGAYVFADIIQAAGIYPIDVGSMGFDFASCSAYKWLYGVHGTGFLYVRGGLADSALDHRRFPGSARHNYRPWTAQPNPDFGDFLFSAPQGGRRFEPGHVSYLGYAAAYEGLGFIEETGVDSLLDHSTGLIQRVIDGLDTDRYDCTTPNPGETPIAAFRYERSVDLRPRLRENGITIALAPDSFRVSTAIWNTEEDVDRLVSVLNA